MLITFEPDVSWEKNFFGENIDFFLGHAAVLGCSKCKKRFPGKIGERDYSGFDKENWPKRTNESHRAEMEEIKLCKTKCEKEAKESEFGTRYSVLIELPYYDSIQMAIIDPMHNLFSGMFDLTLLSVFMCF